MSEKQTDLAGNSLPQPLGSTGYSPYREAEATGSRIGIMTCLRCGATVVIDPGDLEQATTIHDRWHSSMSNTKGEARGARQEEKHE